MIVSQVLAATPLHFDQAAYLAALDRAHARSYHSYFNQYVLTDDEAGFITVDEGDYGALAPRLYDRIVETVPSKLSDED
ncbi:hypothetical protein [Novosphingobium sp. B1]|uniref:hypothetical protein n=1 Tax=Novosphingobium sp. B1 TaxID=1938756 RepID=UPI0009D8441D|nr:hypothetical protein [Novosphingobium sp. B1]SMC30643.1 hypothetical protein SAMN06272759_101151 [Novosphingobium sp. B1]